MSFEKAKDVVAMNTPGVNDISTVLLYYAKLREAAYTISWFVDLNIYGTVNISAAPWDKLRALEKHIEDGITTLHSHGAISTGRYEKLLMMHDSLKTAIENKDLDEVGHAAFQIRSETKAKTAEQIARWARAPKAVGTKRKVTE